MNTKSILMVGVGGQGTILMSKILTEGLLEYGCDVKMCEIHGMAQRGGSVTTQIRFGDKVYSTCIGVNSADVIVAFEKVEAIRFLEYLKQDGTLIVNDHEIYSLPVLTGKAEYPDRVNETLRKAVQHLKLFDANRAAAALGSSKVQNMILMGMTVKALGLEEIDWLKHIAGIVPPSLAELNQNAFLKGLRI